MPRTIQTDKFYYCNETAKAAGISKATLLRWIGRGHVRDSGRRDRNGWRLFSDAEVRRIIRFSETESAKSLREKERNSALRQ